MNNRRKTMSRPIDVKKRCYVCGKISEQTVLASTNQFGAPDLDLRPPEMARNTMWWWLEKCPYCGYVANDLSKQTTITKEWLKNNQYSSCDNRNFTCTLAETFYKHYLINVANNNSKSAFYAVLHTAWVCDDADDVDNAIHCRKKALEELSKFVVNNDEKETFLLMRADLLRRTGQFELLIKEYDGKVFSEELLNKIASFQVEKAKEQDTACYTVKDI